VAFNGLYCILLRYHLVFIRDRKVTANPTVLGDDQRWNAMIISVLPFYLFILKGENMKVIDQFILESVSNISLHPFDEKLYLSLISKHNQQDSHVAFRVNNYDNAYTIKYDNEVCGFISFVRSNFDKNQAFIQIVIIRKFRGRGILQVSEDTVDKNNKLKRLLASIKIKNIASIKAHLKAGFKYFPEDKLNELRLKKNLDKNMTRLYKDYK
jgi:RimJ/RimL family protein N-acetyltransferase